MNRTLALRAAWFAAFGGVLGARGCWAYVERRRNRRRDEFIQQLPEIARILWVAPGTVRKHLDNVYAKLGVSNRTEAVVRACGWTTDPGAGA